MRANEADAMHESGCCSETIGYIDTKDYYCLCHFQVTANEKKTVRNRSLTETDNRNLKTEANVEEVKAWTLECVGESE